MDLISSQFKKLGSVAESERKIFAADLNTIKNYLKFNSKKNSRN